MSKHLRYLVNLRDIPNFSEPLQPVLHLFSFYINRILHPKSRFTILFILMFMSFFSMSTLKSIHYRVLHQQLYK